MSPFLANLSAASAKPAVWGTFQCPREADIPYHHVSLASPNFVACRARVSKARIKTNDAKFSRYFKGIISIGNVRVRSLHGQPGIPVLRELPFPDKKGPPNAGFSHPRKSLETDLRTSGQKFPEVSSRIQENSRFLETRPGDRRISPLHAGVGSELNRLIEARAAF